MFSFLRRLFSKKPTKAPSVAVSAVAVSARPTEVSVPVQRVETAQLALAAIMAKFPDDLRKLVLKMPPAEAMVVMPLPTIQKMLPGGSVKMSLASVVRQAPPGTFSTINPQDKRTVEVPLAEIFKRIPADLLKKRPDQKASELAVEGFDIFGDDENPRALAPRVDGHKENAGPSRPVPAPGLGNKVLKVTPGVVTAPPPDVPLPFNAGETNPPAHAPAAPVATSGPKAMPSAIAAKMAAAQASAKPRRSSAPPPGDMPALFAKSPSTGTPVSEPKTVAAPTPVATPPAAAEGLSPLVLPVQDILGQWPEPVKSEATGQNGATVEFPAAEIATGLAKGRVAFSWGQIRSWMTPPPSGSSAAPDNLELLLPLRVVAPAFMKHSKAGAPPRKAAEVGDIPELFAGGVAPGPRTVAAPAVTPTPALPPTPAPEPALAPEDMQPQRVLKAATAPAQAPEPESLLVVESEATSELRTPAPAGPDVAPVGAELDAPVVGELEPQPVQAALVAEAVPVPSAPIASEVAQVTDHSIVAVEPASLAEAFGEPGKTSWLPSDVVNRLSEQPGVVGALIALQEGLVIAHKLPEPFKGEVFAAFLPQIFARLNQYASEMKLGSVDELVIQASGRPCHLFRRGQVYFAALGAPEARMPAHVLRLCADALAE